MKSALFFVALLGLPALCAAAYECLLCGPGTAYACSGAAIVTCQGSCAKVDSRYGVTRGCFKAGGIDAIHKTECFYDRDDYYCVCNANRCNSSARSTATVLGVLAAVFAGVFVMKGI